jgi:hypothetical protein
VGRDEAGVGMRVRGNTNLCRSLHGFFLDLLDCVLWNTKILDAVASNKALIQLEIQ